MHRMLQAAGGAINASGVRIAQRDRHDSAAERAGPRA
jgi:hypothetical protein